MVLIENYNTSKVSNFLCIAEHFLPSQTTPFDTAKGILNATLSHYRNTHTHSLHHRYLSLRLHLVCTYFIYWDHLLSLNYLACFWSHYKCCLENGRLVRREI